MAPRLTPFLWFDGQAEEAARFYASVFPDSRVLGVKRLSSGPAQGNALVQFEIGKQRFDAVDGGPMFRFTPAISFVIACDTQEEIDYYWTRLAEDGEPQQCGWLVDRFGLSWQVLPAMLDSIMQISPQAVMEALLKMQKIDNEQLRAASTTG
ncbi:MAG: VOC family protein [Anaerolineaceae bacterium]|nr:VOC family protein [Anaerolineaceae bacterium]